MTTTINASTSAGLVQTADTSGSLALQTAGTTAITVDTSQNVGIGTASPAANLDVQAATGPQVRIKPVTGTSYGFLSIGNTGGNFNIGRESSGGGSLLTGSTGYASVLNSFGAYPMQFGTNGAVAMTLDSSGNLLVGATSPVYGERFYVTNSTASGGYAAYFYNSGGSGCNAIRASIAAGGNNTSTAHLTGNTSGIANYYLYGNGTTSYSSDQRLKKNIETTRDGYLADICKLRVVKYNWKNDADGTPKELGLIAQEVEQVFAGLVQDDLNPVGEDDPTIYKQLKQSVIPFMLLKAIQELKAINDQQAETLSQQATLINALTARIEALESKP